ncbi:hypothetical protein ABIB73_001214 [Bradyrhizobium sp. F1.4.3]|uniref:hypothetical protein n=1 Tax=Bradyrhizobium sp. F1.4.3 TaxID=3156356 RepID=UPI00339748D9
MSKRLGLSVLAASLLLSSAPGVAGDADITRAVHGLATGSPGHDDGSTKYADLVRQAPVGHRQPRPSDISAATQLSPPDLELRRLDEEIDRKLIICRGC